MTPTVDSYTAKYVLSDGLISLKIFSDTLCYFNSLRNGKGSRFYRQILFSALIFSLWGASRGLFNRPLWLIDNNTASFLSHNNNVSDVFTHPGSLETWKNHLHAQDFDIYFRSVNYRFLLFLFCMYFTHFYIYDLPLSLQNKDFEWKER